MKLYHSHYKPIKYKQKIGEVIKSTKANKIKAKFDAFQKNVGAKIDELCKCPCASSIDQEREEVGERKNTN